jgi:hypothetical protein
VWSRLFSVGANPFLTAETLAKHAQQGLLQVGRWPDALKPLSTMLTRSGTSPVYEELAYRGGAQWLAVTLARCAAPNRSNSTALASRIVGAAFFGSAHAMTYNDDPLNLPLRLQKTAGTFLSSLLIESRLAHVRRNVWAACGAHMAYNAIAELPTVAALFQVSLALFYNSDAVARSSLGDGARWWLVGGSVALAQCLVLLPTVLIVWRAHCWVLRRLLVALDEALARHDTAML